MSVSRTWRCDIRSRVMTGTLAGREVTGRTADGRAPGDDSAERRLGLIGNAHPVLAGVLAEAVRCAPPRRSSPRRRGVLAELDGTQRADDEDLVVVNGHLAGSGEEVVRQASCEPGLDLRALFGGGPFLRAAGETAPSPARPRAPAAPALAGFVFVMFVMDHEVRLHDYT